MRSTVLRLILLRLLPGRLVPIITVIEVIRVVRRLRQRRADRSERPMSTHERR
jgi:hypothetical protein